MIKLENYEVLGWEHAIRGMRNPMNSWEKSDSFTCDHPVECKRGKDCRLCIGEADHKLMMQLAKAGTDHAKFRRMITVYVDITAPLYWWKEFDTYKVGTVANSCSTMHKIHAKEFTLSDFSHEQLMDGVIDDALDVLEKYQLEGHILAADNNCGYLVVESEDLVEYYSPKNILELFIIPILNANREAYLKTNDKKYWWQMIQLLPSSYNQKRTIELNYEVLANMYKSRKNHKLDCWVTFCEWIKQLPYSEIITGETTTCQCNEKK